jgi:hypothetical protein
LLVTGVRYRFESRHQGSAPRASAQESFKGARVMFFIVVVIVVIIVATLVLRRRRR